MAPCSRSFLPPAMGYVLGALILTSISPSAQAARVTDLGSAFDEAGIIHGGFRLGYQRTLRRGAIKREMAGVTPDEIHLAKELRFSEIRHTLSLRGDVSFWKAFQIYLELPIILSDERSLDFAQNGGDPCGSPPETNCVTPNNSTLGRDGLINAQAMAPQQVAVAGLSGATGGYLLPRRFGLDQLYLGFAGAPFSQERDSTKPTWIIGFEARLGIGRTMEYDPKNPTWNRAVGQGIHQYQWWTSISRRFQYLDPWMTVFYLLPDAKDSSLYEKTTFALSGQERSGPMQRGGTEAGVEIIPWEKPEKKQRVTIELAARLEGVFEGRGYSEMWEIFANNPSLAGPCRPDPASVDPGRWNNGTYCSQPSDNMPYPGITNIENYAIFTGSLAVNLELTKYFRGRIGVSLGHEQQHYITFGDAGKSALPNGKIDIKDEAQVNPLYRPLIENVGRRFLVSDTTVFDFFLSATGQF